MKYNISRMRELYAKKRIDKLTIVETCELNDLQYRIVDIFIGIPLRILAFPVMLIVRLYKWTYENRKGLV